MKHDLLLAGELAVSRGAWECACLQYSWGAVGRVGGLPGERRLWEFLEPCGRSRCDSLH